MNAPILAAQPVVEVLVFGLSAGAVFSLLALGLVLIYRTTGTMNFGHWAIGLLAVVAYSQLTEAGVPPILSAVISIPVSMAAGIASYRIAFRRLDRSRQTIVILVAIGVAQLYASLGTMILGFRQYTRLPAWLPTGDVSFGGATLRQSDLITATAAFVVAFGFLAWFRLSRTGRALRAVAQNREAAQLAGIDDVRASSTAWAIGSALAALALLLVLPHTGGERGGLITTFDTTPLGTLLVPAFGAALVGGLVHLPMALLGGFVFGLAQEMLVLAPRPWSGMRSVVAGLLIVGLLLARTERFFATRQELEALET